MLTIDVEDWYHGISRYVEAHSPMPRLQYSLRKLLDLLEEVNATATFFVLGEVAQRFPDLVGEIADKGHEIGCHGFSHRHLIDIGRDTFDEELGKATKVLEKISKTRIVSFRAALFSLTKKTAWALDVLKKHGYIFDSSIFPTYHPFYGAPDAPHNPYRPSFSNIDQEDPEGEILELPILTDRVLGFNFPLGGGAYLRFLGKHFVSVAITKMNKKGWPATIYLHPWEVDNFVPDVFFNPVVKFITFYRVGKVTEDLESLLKTFRFVSIRDLVAGLT